MENMGELKPVSLLTYIPPLAWNTTDSLPVLMQPLMRSKVPALTILYINRRVRGSTACSWRKERETERDRDRERQRERDRDRESVFI